MGSEWTGRHWRTGEAVTVKAHGGVVSEVVAASADVENWISPGWIDVQVNGMAGHNLNGEQTTPDDALGTAEALWREGVSRFCPTIVTAPQERMLSSLDAVRQACEANELVDHSVLGVHVEGPYISPEDGPRGAHNPNWVRLPDWEEFLAWQEAAGGRIAIVTVAPELPGSLELIRRLHDRGVIAAIGHTAAAAEDIRAAVRAGATMSTHLGNGAHPVIERHPNYIWAQLAEDRLWAGLIPDGFHLPFDTLKVMIRAKAHKSILTSDAAYLAQMPPGRYRTHHGADVVLEPNGLLHLAQAHDVLAGSAATLRQGVGSVIRQEIVGLGEAIDMVSLHPAQLFSLADSGVGDLRPGSPADLVTFNWQGDAVDSELDVVETVVMGEVVYVGQSFGAVGVAHSSRRRAPVLR